MSRKTPAQIDAEITALETMKPLVRQWTMFNDDNHAAIDAQVRVLRERMNNGRVHDVFGQPDDDEEDDFAFDDTSYSEHSFTNALEAADWMSGASNEPSPSANWITALPKGAVLPVAVEPEPEQPKPGRRLISSDEAKQAKCQHKTPCSDCPWARTSLNGWLGGATPDEWVRVAHHDVTVDCHTLKGAQCAGIAIYRANVVKSCEPPMLKLPADRSKVFATPMEFREHHAAMPSPARRLKQALKTKGETV